MPPRPSVKAILICDQIIHDAATNKKSLIGIFQDIHSAQFPFRYPQISVYVNLTDAHGTYVLELRLADSSGGGEIGKGQTPPVEIDSPLKTCEFALQIQSVLFRHPGIYEFQVIANGDLLATKAFTVKQAQPRGHGSLTPPPV